MILFKDISNSKTNRLNKLEKKIKLSIHRTRDFLRFLCGFIALSGLINLIFLSLIPADEKNALILGFSLRRLAMFAFLSIGIVSFVIARKKLSRTSPQTIRIISCFFQQQRVSAFFILLLILITLLVWVAGFSPSYLLQSYYAYAQRLLPIFVWFLSIVISALCLSIFLKNGGLKNVIIPNYRHWRLFTITTMSVIMLFLLIAWGYPKLTTVLKFGRYSVPILMTQIIAAWIIVLLLLLIPGRFLKKLPDFLVDHSDVVIFLLIWVLSAFLWINQPIDFRMDMSSTTIGQHIKPLPPNFEIYPRLDSSNYFYLSESIVIGGGIYRSIDKPLFLAFQGLNNWLAGGSFERMLDLQVVLLALAPALFYLMGSKMHSRAAGLMAAALALMQELNAIRLMAHFPVVSSKVLLTEPFMQLWTVIIALVGFQAFKRSSKGKIILFIAFGGALGLSSLFRLNTAIVLPFILIIAYIYYLRDKRAMIWSTGAILIGVFLAFTPWMIHNAILYGDPLTFIKAKVEGVIINKRYEKILTDINNDTSIINYESNNIISINYTINNNPHEKSADLETTIDNNLPFNNPIVMENQASDIPKILVPVFRHTLNNIITSFSILPTSIRPQDLFHGARSQRFWCDYDATIYEGINHILVIINLIVLSIGIFSVIKNHKVLGLIPIAIFLGYHFSNGIAVSSGNRYTQPVSWVVIFYFSLGLISLSKSLLALLHYDNKVDTGENKAVSPVSNRNVIVPIILSILLIGSTPVIADLMPINRFPIITEQQVYSSLFSQENLQNNLYGKNIEELLSKYKKNSVVVEFGRALTPILINDVEFKQIFYGENNYGQNGKYLTFMFFGPGSGNTKRMFFNSQNKPIALPNGSDVVMVYSADNPTEALSIGIIDPVFASQVTSYINQTNIPLSTVYFSESFATVDK